MKKTKNKLSDDIYDIHNELIKHNDIVKVIRVNENNQILQPCVVGKFYRVENYGEGVSEGVLLCLVINKTGTLYPMFNLIHVDFEIQNKK